MTPFADEPYWPGGRGPKPPTLKNSLTDCWMLGRLDCTIRFGRTVTTPGVVLVV